MEATLGFWLARDYLPELRAHTATQSSLPDVLDTLDVRDVQTLEVPRECRDGFLGANWARPESYLDPIVRAGMSGIQLLDQDVIDRAVAQLASDINDGSWARRNAELVHLDALDVGFRLVIAGR
jgi:hypothetical protein